MAPALSSAEGLRVRVRTANARDVFWTEEDAKLDIAAEIARQIERLPPEMQEEVLRFASALASSARVGENGAALKQFASSLDPLSAREMVEAIEEGCERVDAGEW
jgi:hypothetical protein